MMTTHCPNTPHRLPRHPVATASRRLRGALAVAATLATLVPMSGCAPLLLGGAALGGGMVLTDRRTSGTQLEDESIELKSGGRIRDAIGGSGHVNVTSYNRVVLITGEVANEADRDSVGKAVGKIENVAGVTNELAVAGASSMTSRSNDALLTSKVKASYIDAKDLQSNAIKIVTERAIVYLMGRVSEREAARAAEIARGVGGVQKVVRVFEILSDDELAKLQTR